MNISVIVIFAVLAMGSAVFGSVVLAAGVEDFERYLRTPVEERRDTLDAVSWVPVVLATFTVLVYSVYRLLVWF